MNRFFRLTLSAFILLAMLLPQMSFAGWHTDEVGWHITYVGGFTGTAIVQRDTLLASFGGGSTGNLDTTSVFSLDDADVPPRGVQAAVVVNGSLNGAAQNDTTLAGFLTVQCDTSVATVANGTYTVFIEGRIAGVGSTATNAVGWSRVDSTVVTLGAVADQSFSIPIRTIGKYASVFAFSQLRARTTSTAANMSSARVFLRWWKNDASNMHRP